MNEILLELLKQVPNAVAVIVTVYLFLHAQEKQEATRTQNAKALEAERQKHEREINNMWAGFLKRLSDENAKNFQTIIEAIHKHEDRALQRYNRMSKVSRKMKAIK